jgi:hypothetical protein
MSEQEMYEKAIEHWGEAAQIDMAIEECAELILSLMHRLRRRNSIEDVAEEVADVEIMCGQLRLMVGSDLVDQVKVRKLERLQQLLEGGGGDA